uniref:Uncharacterized protein n=1 Tax=Lactuca sativa TaxID=4236 RepID=A0A9R1XPI8_LACSA|nr:hypothetical protein LSAT_V11C200088860 [Lactuca sativa]
MVMLRKSLHAATYWLNSDFQYDQESFCKKPKVVVGFIDMIECYDSVCTISGLTLIGQLNLFRENEDSFSRTLVFASQILLIQSILIFVSRLKDNKKSYDTLNYKSIDKIDF